MCECISLSLCSALHVQLPCSSVARDAKRGKATRRVLCPLEVVGPLTLHTFFSEKGSARGSYIFYLAAGINVILFLTRPSTLPPRVRCCAPPPRVCGRAVSARLCTPYSSALFRNSSHRAEKIINIVCVAREHRFCHTH